MGSERFIYQLTVRPAGPDTTPLGVGRELHDTDVVTMGRQQFGSVSYDEGLPLEQIVHYALLPYSQMRAVNGKEYTQVVLGVRVRHLVCLSANHRALIVQTMRAGRIDHVATLTWQEFVLRSKSWQPLNPLMPEGASR